MPVRSLNSFVLVWPDHVQVESALHEWARGVTKQRADLLRLGYFGSYARGDWGVGSDLDIVMIVNEAAERFEHRSLRWDLSTLPVPAELLIYTEAEWQRLQAEGGRFARMLADETVWIYPHSSKKGQRTAYIRSH